MATYRASRELLATPADVWRFIAEPGHLADWWPGIAAVEPDRRGLAVGARWRVRSGGATYFRKAGSEDTLVVTAADPERRFVFELVEARARVELALASAAQRHTEAELTVRAPWLAVSRRLPGHALERLHDLCQTTVEL